MDQMDLMNQPRKTTTFTTYNEIPNLHGNMVKNPDDDYIREGILGPKTKSNKDLNELVGGKSQKSVRI